MTIDLLRARLEGGDQDFAWAYNPITRQLSKWIAFREGNKDVLKQHFPGGWKADRPYKHDPLAKKISQAFADFLYGEDPLYKPSDPDDTELLLQLVEANELSTELHQSVQTYSSEGEVWWRIYTDPEQADFPLVEWHSRTTAYPYWRGRTFTAVAFVYEVERKDHEVWRYVQYHEKDRVVNMLYKSTAYVGPMDGQGGDDEDTAIDVMRLQKLGDAQPLRAHGYTAGLDPEWEHDQGMLAGRFVNNVPRTRKIGKSDYDGIEDLLFDLDEAHTVDGENYRLAGKKRAIMPRKYQDQAGEADIREEVFWVDDGVDEMEQETGPFKILEYNYNAQDSIRRKDDLTNTAITRVGLVRQFVNSDTSEGWAQSGTALRTRLLPTSVAAHGKAREYDTGAPRVLQKLIQIDALDEGKGGFGRPWKDPNGLPAITRQSVMPEDPGDRAQRHQTLITAELESIEAAVEDLHQDWTPEQKNLEVRRILANRNGAAIADDGTMIVVAAAPPPAKPSNNGDVPDQPEPVGATERGGAE